MFLKTYMICKRNYKAKVRRVVNSCFGKEILQTGKHEILKVKKLINMDKLSFR